MNWYNKILLIKHILQLDKISNQKENIIKTSAILGDDPSTDLDWKNQAEDYIAFGNFQRYVCDSQTIKVFLTQTESKLTISLITNHTYLGTAGWSIFWTLDLDRKKEAKELFRIVSSIARETVEEFVREEKPTVMLHAVLRQKYKKLQRDEVVRTNIPTINYSYDIPYETDWRKSIYGTRYPPYKEVSFNQYLNSSIYSNGKNAPSGKFAL